jgi:hypothetical protein
MVKRFSKWKNKNKQMKKTFTVLLLSLYYNAYSLHDGGWKTPKEIRISVHALVRKSSVAIVV